MLCHCKKKIYISTLFTTLSLLFTETDHYDDEVCEHVVIVTNAEPVVEMVNVESPVGIEAGVLILTD